MNDEQQIRNLIQRWGTAVHTGDLPGVLADHATDIVMFDVPPPEQGVRGIDDYRDTWPGFFQWQATGALFDIESLEVTAGADVAFAFALLRCGTPADFDRHPDHRLRLTIGLRKIDDRWTVTHEHHSFARHVRDTGGLGTLRSGAVTPLAPGAQVKLVGDPECGHDVPGRQAQRKAEIVRPSVPDRIHSQSSPRPAHGSWMRTHDALPVRSVATVRDARHEHWPAPSHRAQEPTGTTSTASWPTNDLDRAQAAIVAADADPDACGTTHLQESPTSRRNALARHEDRTSPRSGSVMSAGASSECS